MNDDLPNRLYYEAHSLLYNYMDDEATQEEREWLTKLDRIAEFIDDGLSHNMTDHHMERAAIIFCEYRALEYKALAESIRQKRQTI